MKRNSKWYPWIGPPTWSFVSLAVPIGGGGGDGGLCVGVGGKDREREEKGQVQGSILKQWV